MGNLPWKVRIAVLWVCGPVLESAHLLLVSETEYWLVRHGNLVVHSTFFYLLPLVMAFLSLTLKDKPNRWVNLIIGIIPMFIFYIINFLECGLGVVVYNGPSIGLEQTLILGLKVIITAFIPWFAWRWPKQEA